MTEHVQVGDLIPGAAQLQAKVAGQRGDLPASPDWRQAQEPLDRPQATPPDDLPASGADGACGPEDAPALAERVRDPARVAAAAHRQRLELARLAGVVELAQEIEASREATNSLETLLAHQLAALHGMAMRMAEQMNRQIEQMTDPLDWKQQRARVEACRLGGLVSRASTTFQQGVLALHRTGSGGGSRQGQGKK